ncbi:TonB family protein [Sphingomonas sp.]|uniref:TonB family protein n=1 Tax=Sphingomonas sp. TaxID=28214 RepID=UPI003CC69EF1
MTAEQRTRDGRLAWIIVTGCALVTATLLTLLVAAAVRRIPPSFDRAPFEADVAARRRRVLAIPANTATPVGDPAGWPAKAGRPAEPMARGEDGAVRVTLTVNVDGVPTGCAVAQSSGYDDLDSATCNAMLWAADFRPVRHGAAGPGSPGVRYWTSPPIDWNRIR